MGEILGFGFYWFLLLGFELNHLADYGIAMLAGFLAGVLVLYCDARYRKSYCNPAGVGMIVSLVSAGAGVLSMCCSYKALHGQMVTTGVAVFGGAYLGVLGFWLLGAIFEQSVIKAVHLIALRNREDDRDRR